LKKVSFLFWNINKRPVSHLISSIVRENDIDILMLAECEIPVASLLTELNSGTSPQFSLPTNPSTQFTILVRLPAESLLPVRDFSGMAIRLLKPPIGIEVSLVVLHLRSKLFSTENEQALFCTRLIRYIEEAEHDAGHSRTVVVGDLNMNPFEAGMIGAEGFHAVMDRRTAAKGTRLVQGVRRSFFYNPMWSHLGDASPGPPGTYYYYGSGQISYFWNMFDQILIRPELLGRLDHDDLKIVSTIGSVSLLSTNQIPDHRVGSDHLPILFRMNLAEVL